MTDFLHQRGQALEDAFFHERDRVLLAKLKAATAAGDIRKELTAAVGIDDDDVIDKLVALGITPETALAISMVPLVQVAWADGCVQEAEHHAILSAAEESGVSKEPPALGILESWMANEPGDGLLDAWHAYIHALVGKLTDKERTKIKEFTLHRARLVAGVAGGILGFGSKFSRSEEAVLDDLAKSFDK